MSGTPAYSIVEAIRISASNVLDMEVEDRPPTISDLRTIVSFCRIIGAFIEAPSDCVGFLD
ncbi:hypothetical protein CAL7716_042300 [Calothrix sp. PCC 7716]|nr:hypothetical protein CAL7716_042300 [Calothrix sp. PCC 7716]